MEDDFETDEHIMDDSFDESCDFLLEQQELQDFAQDGHFENMEPNYDGTWS
jgi:hypothetical protein